jgi:hypothetical protein
VLCRNLCTADLPKPLRFLTLTLKSRAEPLRLQLQRLYANFKKLRKAPQIHDAIRGGVFFCEVTMNADSGLFHPHLHVLFSGKFLPVELVRKLWHVITGDSYIVDVRAVRDVPTAAAYVAKYAAKCISAETYNSPEHLDAAILALRGVRTFNTFGTWKTFNLRQDKEDLLDWEVIGTITTIRSLAEHGDALALRALRFCNRWTAESDVAFPTGLSPPPEPARPASLGSLGRGSSLRPQAGGASLSRPTTLPPAPLRGRTPPPSPTGGAAPPAALRNTTQNKASAVGGLRPPPGDHRRPPT